jgi:2-hydroxychromene-2-carboxylate isomerase
LFEGWLITEEVQLVVESDRHPVLNLASVDPGDFAAHHTSPNSKGAIHTNNFELARGSWGEPQAAFDENALARGVYDPDLLRLDLDCRDLGNLVEWSTP